MLPLIPFIAGGVALFGAGFVAKQVYDDYELEIKDSANDIFSELNDWFEDKQDTLDRYADETIVNNSSSYSDEDYSYENLIQAKKRAYLGAYIKFLSLQEKVKNSSLESVEFVDIDFSKFYTESKEIMELKLIDAITDVLTKSDKLLVDLNISIVEILKNKSNYEEFTDIEKRVYTEANSLAKFILNVSLQGYKADEKIEEIEAETEEVTNSFSYTRNK